MDVDPLRLVCRGGRVPARHDRPVLRPPIRDGLPERAAARPGGRSRSTPCYDLFAEAGARNTVNWGLEVPLYFAPDPGFVEVAAFGRSNAEPIVAEEVAAVRTAAGAAEIAQYSRYEVTGPGAEAWLDQLLAAAHPGARADPAGADAGSGRTADGRPDRHPAGRGPLLADRLVLPPGLAPALVPRPPADERRYAAEPVRGADGLLGLRACVPRDPGRADATRTSRMPRSRSSPRARCGSGRPRRSSGGSR